MEFEHKVDKTGWAEGEWHNEPDYLSWTDKETDMACLIVRSQRSGALCGYVAVEEKHPLFERHYDVASDLANIEVHGGLTFGDFCTEPICHVPAPGKPDKVWWFGFDCAHFLDITPGFQALWNEAGVNPLKDEPPHYVHRYWNVDRVKAEVESLAVQLKKAETCGVS